MAKPQLEVEGLKELRKQLKAAGESYAEIKEAGKEAGEIVASEARQIVPRLSGALEQSIRAAGQAGGAVVRAGTSLVKYAGPIHFGWPAHNIEPNPFLYKAADARVAEVQETYLRALEKINDTVTGASP